MCSHTLKPILRQRITFAPNPTDSSPLPTAPITTPAALLAVSKRKLSQYEGKLGDWSELFTKTGSELRDAGMSVSDRRYVLWLLEKYRYVPPARAWVEEGAER